MNLYQIFQPMLLKSMHPLIWQHINLNTILLKHFFTSKMRQIIFIITHRLKIYQLLKYIDQGFFGEACICIKQFLSKRKLKNGNPNIIKFNPDMCMFTYVVFSQALHSNLNADHTQNSTCWRVAIILTWKISINNNRIFRSCSFSNREKQNSVNT